MPLNQFVRIRVVQTLERYEGRVPHLYLDINGNVTVGVGHLVANRNAIKALPFFHERKGQPGKSASSSEKLAEFDRVKKQPYGLNYGAAWYDRHTRLMMRDQDINLLRDKHIRSFYRELKRIYSGFDGLPIQVQAALFDMIFNLGATTLRKVFTDFNQAIRNQNWEKAARECGRSDVQKSRNQYVRSLLRKAAHENQVASGAHHQGWK